MSRYMNVDEFLADESEAYMKAQITLAEQNADKTIDATRYVNQVVHKKILMLIADTPTIDIVRCSECKWRKAKMMPKSVKCLFSGKDDDFCSYGEREGE